MVAKFAPGGKYAAGVVDTGGNLPPVSLTLVANLPPVSGLRKFSKKFEMTLLLFSGA
jgi:hypothetical protein